MGANDVSEIFKGRLSNSEVQNEFKKLSKWADSYYGHQEGYSGSWNTISGPIEKLRDEPFESKGDAYKALCSSTEKWSGKYAFYYESKLDKDSAKAKKAQAKVSALEDKISEEAKKAEILFEAIGPFKKENPDKKIKCPHCESQYKIAYLPFHLTLGYRDDLASFVSECPVCNSNVGLVSELKGIISKLEKQILKINELKNELTEAHKILNEAVLIKTKEVSTIIYGLASS